LGLDGLVALHRTGQLTFFRDLTGLAEAEAFARYLAPLRKAEWVVYAKPPFGGTKAVLAYLSRYTHRIAISNSRLVSADADTVAFRWKDYRLKRRDRMKVMRPDTHEFIRRFLIHVLTPSRQYPADAPAGQRTASSASATTACWQALPARPTSRRYAHCSGRKWTCKTTLPRPKSSR